MDYDCIISATYNWFSLEKLAWFLVFFWLSFFALVFVPVAVGIGWYSQEVLWIVNGLIGIMYIALILALIVLTCHTLGHNSFSVEKLSLGKFIDTIFLIILELWYILVWNIHKAYRVTQLLLLFGIPLLYVYSLSVQSMFISAALIFFLICYVAIVIYNSIRLLFSVTVFYNHNFTIKKTIKESWHLTHKKFWKILIGLIFALAALFVLFIVISIILGAILHIILLNYFTNPIAYKIAVNFAQIFALAPVVVGYYFAVIEIYSQIRKEAHSSRRIKRILAKRVVAPKIKAKKKVVKKKVKKKLKKKAKKVSKRKTKTKVKKKTTKKRK
jgi:hypothetical protein